MSLEITRLELEQSRVRYMPIKITDIIVRDIRFPTSQTLAGSDAMNSAPDYSAAYVVLKTDHPQGLEGHGLTFTIGRGNELFGGFGGAAAVRACH